MADEIVTLVNELARLPGIGRKTAQRLAYHLIGERCESAYALADAIRAAKDNVVFCSVCGNITTADPCAICTSRSRDKTTICVVADSRDVLAIEKSRGYNGLYHVLGGVLSPMQGIGPDALNIARLMSRLSGDVREVILATSLGVEGETTASYLARLIKPLGIRTTRIAKGIPSGAELEYADELTLAGALEGRREI
jgi:recombination protein RecR